ncbi:hypothetical protein [Silvibacterium dinghuense]|uniref:Uncharacterized protein n=1 Tax=Silvibacterium dinghuense TaxID=1560006 RepID=A0A4Q1S9S7_9BACT|nr:hypothetical protein [Silvibacterium dinghuense]RXS93816.1 hypothetical protein ESZ00_17400 [Silvibacterium dinghuense]
MALQYEKQQLSSTYQACNPSHPQKAQAEKVVPQATATRHNGRPARGQTTVTAATVQAVPAPVTQTEPVTQVASVTPPAAAPTPAQAGSGPNAGEGGDTGVAGGSQAGDKDKGGTNGTVTSSSSPAENPSDAGDKNAITQVDIEIQPPDTKKLVACSDVVFSFKMKRAKGSMGQADLTDAAISASWSSDEKTAGTTGTGGTKNTTATGTASKGESTPAPQISAITLKPVDNDPAQATGTFTIYRIPAGAQSVTLNLALPYGYDTEQAKLDLSVLPPDEANGALNCIRQMPPLLLTAVGVDVEGASSTSPGAKFLANSSLDEPLTARLGANAMQNIRDAHVFIGGSLRISGMAQPGTLSASAFSSAGYYASAVNATPDKIVQSWEGVGNVSVKLFGGDLRIGTFDSGKAPYPYYPRYTYTTLSLLFSGGFNSPLSASQASPPVYYATTQIQNQYPSSFPTGSNCAYDTTKAVWPCYVAFIPDDRTRFYRHYEAGLRLKLYGEDFEHSKLRYPGTLDVAFGQNEYVTGGKMHGLVLHMGGVIPFPLPIPKFDALYAFGALDSELNGPMTSCTQNNTPCQQLILVPVPASSSITYLSPNVVNIPTAEPNRDRYRFGFGIDILHLLTANQQKQ